MAAAAKPQPQHQLGRSPERAAALGRRPGSCSAACFRCSLAWRRFSDGSAEADAAQAVWQASSWRPQVDVLIPTCGEPLPVLERCLRACSQLQLSPPPALAAR